MYGYDERKAAQIAAYFALRQGGRVNVLKLAKLMYLAERESMRAFDEPMFYDKLVSMDHGPVASISLNHVNGLLPSDIWPMFVKGRDGFDVVAVDGLAFESLDHLSAADLDILGDLWAQFGNYDQFRLRDWTHQNCLEWENPHGSSTGIPADRVFKFLSKAAPEMLAEAVHEHRLLDHALVGPA
jgi:uncharacterized phage-associated protein